MLLLKKSQNSQESTYAGVSNIAKFLRHVFYRTAPVAETTDYSGLYNFASNSNSTSLVKENYLDFIQI